jgi:hypothetical protein
MKAMGLCPEPFHVGIGPANVSNMALATKNVNAGVVIFGHHSSNSPFDVSSIRA